MVDTHVQLRYSMVPTCNNIGTRHTRIAALFADANNTSCEDKLKVTFDKTECFVYLKIKLVLSGDRDEQN